MITDVALRSTDPIVRVRASWRAQFMPVAAARTRSAREPKLALRSRAPCSDRSTPALMARTITHLRTIATATMTASTIGVSGHSQVSRGITRPFFRVPNPVQAVQASGSSSAPACGGRTTRVPTTDAPAGDAQRRRWRPPSSTATSDAPRFATTARPPRRMQNHRDASSNVHDVAVSAGELSSGYSRRRAISSR